ncbi:MAG: hypothetical protein KAH32_01635, partial [Chlamydiia bacterium]|nr:hypothetical protein [Chlamydiia bacterium]
MKKCKIINCSNLKDCIYIISKIIQSTNNQYCQWDVVTNHENLSSYVIKEILKENRKCFGITPFGKGVSGWLYKHYRNICNENVKAILNSQKLQYWNIYKAISNIEGINNPQEITDVLFRKTSITDGVLESAINDDNINIQEALKVFSSLFISHKTVLEVSQKNIEIKTTSFSNKVLVCFLPHNTLEEEFTFLCNLSKQSNFGKVYIFYITPNTIDTSDNDIENITKPANDVIYPFLNKSFSILENLEDNFSNDIDIEIIQNNPKDEYKDILTAFKDMVLTKNTIPISKPYTNNLAIFEHPSIESEAEHARDTIFSYLMNNYSPGDIVFASPALEKYIPILSKWINVGHVSLINQLNFSSKHHNVAKCISIILSIAMKNTIDIRGVKQILSSNIFLENFEGIDDCLSWITKNIYNSHNPLSTWKSKIEDQIKYNIKEALDLIFLKPLVHLLHMLDMVSNIQNSESIYYYQKQYMDIVHYITVMFSKNIKNYDSQILSIKRSISLSFPKGGKDVIIDKSASLNKLKRDLLKPEQIHSKKNEIVLSDLKPDTLPPCKLLILCGITNNNLPIKKESFLNADDTNVISPSINKFQEMFTGIINTDERVILSYNTYADNGASWIVQYIHFLILSCLNIDTAIEKEVNTIISRERFLNRSFINANHLAMLENSKDNSYNESANPDIKKNINIDFKQAFRSLVYRSKDTVFHPNETQTEPSLYKGLKSQLEKTLSERYNLLFAIQDNKLSQAIRNPCIIILSENTRLVHFDLSNNTIIAPAFRYKNITIRGQIYTTFSIENKEISIEPILIEAMKSLNKFKKIDSDSGYIEYNKFLQAILSQIQCEGSEYNLVIKPLKVYALYKEASDRKTDTRIVSFMHIKDAIDFKFPELLDTLI